MPVDPSFVGRTYPPSEPYRVSREKIREFADAIGDPNPAYRSVEAARALGHADVVAPPTFAIVLTLKAGEAFLFDPAAGVDYSRVVHGDQRFVHERPLVAGDEITTALTVDTIRSAGGNEIIGNSTEVRTTDGELVATAYATIVVRGESS
ncbi:MaoC family dehydratase N-terminal domain-containing protein [uncultured Jatrophihabitans sp.]|uniref:FAS1-like dehydratase domain-containing protein n=1 Tax=uncultured Jatrophihabitans sp. TaxID=1610747 RepID=UPI0035C978EC